MKSFFAQLREWVYAGLAQLARQGGAGPVLESFEKSTASVPWRERDARFTEAIAARACPLSRLLAEHATRSAERFVVATAALLEVDMLVALAVAEAQQPAEARRLTLHLAEELARALFSEELTPDVWLGSSTRSRALLEIAGDGPLTLRELVFDARLWSAVLRLEPCWPSCRLLPRGLAVARADMAELPRLAAHLEQIHGTLVLRSAQGENAEAYASALATQLERTALEVDASVWLQTPSIAAACAACDWLPVVRTRIGAGEVLSMPSRGLTQVVSLGIDGAVEASHALELRIGTASFEERLASWHEAFGVDPSVTTIAGATLLPAPLIARVSQLARSSLARSEAHTIADGIAEARRVLSSNELRLLAHPVTRRVARDALVLPNPIADDLERYVMRCLQRDRVWDGLGPSLAVSRTAGARALFVGESGTGKTLAASYVATRLGAPLFRVDLAAVMNKYVGESEKNLGKLLDVAELHDVVILFDEADALFGQRQDGGENAQRFANMLTNFLLTRLENHAGVVVLTANSRHRIDAAFVRRLDSIVDFPLPGPGERMKLWQSHLGKRSPGDDVLQRLSAYSDLPGGHIRNAVLNAAAHAQGVQPIPAPVLLEAVAREYRKLSRALPAALQPTT